jgi:serine/threonine protein kinase/formylglycine-generating enzyme required for sulfatase activity
VVLERLAAEFVERHRRGECPPLSEYTERYPDLAGDIRRLFPALVQLEKLKPAAAPTGEFEPPAVSAAGICPERLGEYRILRQVGWGGMGVVYEAEQESLGRRVALKVLPASALRNPTYLERFRREAKAAARLHHTNIVPVFGTGEAGGVPFYAMQFIRGEGLDKVLLDVRRLRRRAGPAGDALPPTEGSVAHGLVTGRFAAPACGPGAPAERPAPSSGTSGLSGSGPEAEYWRGVARIGVQAAEALAYAHRQGILHRDVKPSNLLLDQQGTVWITDFGLAKAEEADELTPTGDVVGTLRFMAPERFNGQSLPQSDVYALGLTLYEMLTLRPGFGESDKMKLIDKVLHESPPPPRRIDPHVPRDLETVVLKCLAKDPRERYAGAEAVAEDLRRFLADRPIRARRATAGEQVWRWGRRNPAVAGLLGAVLLVFAAGAAVSALFGVEARRQAAAEVQARKGRALAQVDALVHADPRAVPVLLSNLGETQEDVLPRLRELWEQSGQPLGRLQRGRVGLALLPVEPARVKGWLYGWMLEADDPRELLLLRDGLAPYREGLRGDLWRRVEDPATPREARFQALAALADFDRDSGRWPRYAGAVVEELVQANSLTVTAWAEALRPIRGALLGPLAEVFRGRKLAEKKQVAAMLLADYAADRPDLLADLALDADARQYAELLPRLKARAGAVRPLLKAELARTPAAGAADAEKEALAFRQANAALTLLHLGEADPVWRLLVHRPDPTRRAYLLHHLAPYGIDAGVVLDRLPVESDVSARRALLLALGEYAPDRVPPARREELLARLVRDYREDPDAGMHGAVEWLLRQWQEGGRLPPLRNHRPGGRAPGKPTWFVNGRGQTFTLIPGPVEFRMGSPASELDREPIETQHLRRIGRSFALATQHVTARQFREFLAAHPEVGHSDSLPKYLPEPECPINRVSWYEAAMYCRWLSEVEGIPEDQMCYPPVEEIRKCRQDKSPLRLPADHLSRTGYRLPTGAEWEYACRAGALTSRPYGSADGLLNSYAWHIMNSRRRTWPVGMKKPNDWGLFDMLGNLWQWCQEGNVPYPPQQGGRPVEDTEDGQAVSDNSPRITRGASFDNPPVDLRSGHRGAGYPMVTVNAYGMRVARTFPGPRPGAAVPP